MNYGTGKREPVAITNRIHHSEVHISNMTHVTTTTLQSKKVARMWIGMEVAKFQQLL